MVDLRARTQTLSAITGYMAFYGVGDNLLSGTRRARTSDAACRSPTTSSTCSAIRPQLGRVFTKEECLWNGPKAVMLSDGLWRRRFAANPAIVGTALTLNDEPHTVVGVLPAVVRFRVGVRARQPFRSLFPVSPERGDQRAGATPWR